MSIKCWDCGTKGRPIVDWKRHKGVILSASIGWRCECGQWWPVSPGAVGHWASAVLQRINEKFVEGDIEEIRAALERVEAKARQKETENDDETSAEESCGDGNS